MKVNVRKLDRQPTDYASWEEPIRTHIGFKYRPIKENGGYTFLFRASAEGKHSRLIYIVVDRSGTISFDGYGCPKSNNEWYIKQTIEHINELYDDLLKAGLLVSEDY